VPRIHSEARERGIFPSGLRTRDFGSNNLLSHRHVGKINTDEAEVPDQEKIEALDQDNPRIIGITNTPTSTNEVWMVVGKKKKSHVTSQPMVT
jgi:hypothetical protein